MDRAFDADPTVAAERDEADPLAGFADRFHVPEGELYMDGNSLGPLSTDAERTLERVVDEWRELRIEGWTEADPPWFRYAERLGDRLAPLVGADGEEVVVANSTTVNVHTLVGTFLDEAGGDGKVIVDELDFPTDHYAVRAQLRQRGLDPDEHLVVVESRDGRTIEEDDVVAAMDEHDDAAVLFLPSVLYRSGQLLDVERLTRAAQERGVFAGFDLAHSVGVVPHDLSDCGVDFATWCSYKYLNAGPGAIAGLYVNEEHFGATPALAGWWGHEKETQFEMNPTFTPADSAGAWQIGTVPMLSAAPLEGSLDVIADAGIDAVREKSLALTDYLIDLADARLADLGYAIGTPRDPTRRGGHVALEHERAERISRALRDRGVVVDYRPPNVVRVCPSPLYTSFHDVYEAVRHCWEVVADREYERYGADGDDVT
ncbi:kynureninase [Halostella sp. JP-L12]|uniref:kynureninase n=1 Tax=Halostella TaxID=1843185 RepID=UPI000EF75D58|nr:MULTISPECIES: kynureninase [Halostella]NHN48861.1 kynureninase [Halostella sp. JP-L12]